MTAGCIACDLTSGVRELPGGRIRASRHWVVEHCVGALGIGTLIVKPLRHCLNVGELSAEEAAELGPLLKHASRCTQQLSDADQVYVCLWSHAGWVPGHIHFVVQPAWNSSRERFSGPGPTTQIEMFREGRELTRAEVEAFCDRARAWPGWAELGADAYGIAGLQLRTARVGDLAAMHSIRRDAILGIQSGLEPDVRQTWADRRSTEFFADRVAMGEALIARAADEDVGWGSSAEDRVTALYVHSSHGQRGVGRALMSALEAAIAARGHAYAKLESSPNAIGFYAKLGYAAEGDLQDGALPMSRRIS